MEGVVRPDSPAAPVADSPALAEPQFELPLGWSWNGSADDAEHFDLVALPSGAKFVYTARLSPVTTPAELAGKLLALGGEVIIRSCSPALAASLGRGSVVQLTSSANLVLEGYRPPHKVRNLARRGAKAVEVRELKVDASAAAVVEPWLTRLRERSGPSLQYLFRTQLTQAQRAFAAFAPGAAEPSGLVTLTRYGRGAWHIELMCRDPEAPQGTMEHLLVQLIETLSAERASALNLGEVGLDFAAPLAPMSWFNRLIVRLTPLFIRLVRRTYDVAGLHRFKNKFEPTWEPRVFWGSRLRFMDFVAMARLSGISRLF